MRYFRVQKKLYSYDRCIYYYVVHGIILGKKNYIYIDYLSVIIIKLYLINIIYCIIYILYIKK